MAVTEKIIQEAFQTAFQGLALFADADVTINDWSFVDRSTQGGPYIVLITADNFIARQDTVTATDDFDVRFELWEAVDPVSDGTTLNNFRDHRQTVIDMVVNTLRSAGGQAGIMITELRSEGPITPYFDRHIPAEQLPFSDPIFLYQAMTLACKEF